MTSPFRTIALIGKYNSPDIAEPLLKLAKFLRGRNRDVIVARHTGSVIGNSLYPMADMREIGEQADLLIVIGGDGTMLNIARSMADYNLPLVGINQGRLGFLTDVSIDTMLDTIGEMLDGEFITEERLLLNGVILRKGQPVLDACAFNDVVVSKANTGRLIEFEVLIDGQFVYSQRSDGVVVATPTGSTAYALSAGGPILHPTLEAFALVPICPHTLSARPIAVNSNSTLQISLIHADDARVHFDGQRRFDLLVNDQVIIRRAPHSVRLLHPLGHSYYDTLRQKLHWGEKL